MSTVRFIADLHLGHKNILKFAGDYRIGPTIHEHDWWLVRQWNRVVTTRDFVWVLGDVAFDVEALDVLNYMNGTKGLILGNHDKFDLGVYRKYFKEIHGFKKRNGFWLSHAPMHPNELRGRPNIHGHIHQNIEVLDGDTRYIPVCVELCAGCPVSIDDIRNGVYKPLGEPND